jgi:hypothetical protein
MIDTNVDMFRWPFRCLAGDDPADLVARLRKKGVTQAWTGSYEGLLHRDVAGVNERLAAACKRYGRDFLLPFGTVNPKQPDWQEDLRRCHEVHEMPGIRLHPNYHGYTLDDSVAAELISLTERRKLLVQISLAMEDDRTQNALMPIPPVDPSPLIDLAKRMPNLRLVLINGGDEGNKSTAHIPELGEAGNIYFDIARIEGIGGVARLIAQTSPARVVFGSHYPFFYFESSLLKVREAGLPPDQAQAVLDGTARGLLKC